MTIIVYSDVIVPECVFTPASGGSRTRQNSRTMNQGGFASANVVRGVTLRTYSLSTIVMTLDNFQRIINLAEVTDYGAFGMLMKDPVDSQTTSADGVLQGYISGVESGAIGYGNGGPLYGFRKLYAIASRAKTWPVTRPISPVITRAGSPVSSGVSAGNISISAGPSYVTFVADASRSVSIVTVGATTQVTLASAIPGLGIGDLLWLDTLSGADAGLLNDKSHTITNITGVGLNVYTLSTNTAGKTITSGSGQGRKYPQPTEQLLWTGEYYTPVQFASDNLDWDLARPGDYEDRLIAGSSISLIEVREA